MLFKVMGLIALSILLWMSAYSTGVKRGTFLTLKYDFHCIR